MGKIYASLGYKINYKGRDYYNSDDRNEMLDAVWGLADWPPRIIKKIEKSTAKELADVLLESGFEFEETPPKKMRSK